MALVLVGGAASAQPFGYGYSSGYVTTYRPVTHYVRRTVVVRERVWRPVRHRVYYPRPVYRHHVYVRRYVYAEPYAYGYDRDWRHDDWRWRRDGWDRAW